MRLDRLFLGVNILLILISVAAHEIAAEEYAFLAGLIPLCIVVYWLNIAGRGPALNDRWATLLCGLAFAIMMYRGLGGGVEGGQLLDVRVPRVGEFLIAFQAVYLLRRRVMRDYFWMYLVSVVHMGTAGLLMPGFNYAFFFVAYAGVGVLAVALYHAANQVESAGLDPAGVRMGKLGLLAAVPATVVLVVVVAAVFVALPRRLTPSTIGPHLVNLQLQPVTGFSPTMELGKPGTIQENPQRVMRVAQRGENAGMPIPYDILLRGASMDVYRHDSVKGWVWERGPNHMANYMRLGYGGPCDVTKLYSRSFPNYEVAGARTVSLEIVREPTTTAILFVPWAPITMDMPRDRILSGNRISHMLTCTNVPRSRALTYGVTASLYPPGGAGPGHGVPPDYLAPYLALPPEMSPKIKALAQTLVPPKTVKTDIEKAERINKYLSDSGNFAYSLTWEAPRDVEPVEEFLFNRKQGACEYYAASMVLLLRAAGVPARVVNGYRMDEWNQLGGYYIVRQSDAHAWVEAYIRPGGWRTYDPTAQRAAGLNRPAPVRRVWRMVYDTGERMWVTNVLNFAPDDQAAFYKSFARFVDTAESLWLTAMVLAGGQTLSLTPYQADKVIETLKGPLATAAEYAAGVAISCVAVWLAWWIMRVTWRWYRRRARNYYERMERILEARGHKRPPGQTPREFERHLAGKGWPRMAQVTLVTDTLCRERYAEEPVSAEQMRDVDAALRDLRRAPTR